MLQIFDQTNEPMHMDLLHNDEVSGWRYITRILVFADAFSLVTDEHVTAIQSILQQVRTVIGPIPWGHSGPLCHALSLLLLMSWTLHAAYAIAIAGVRLATPGDWQCNGGSQ